MFNPFISDMNRLGPPVVPFLPFFGGGSPTKIDYSKKLVPTYSNLSTEGPRLVAVQPHSYPTHIGQAFGPARLALTRKPELVPRKPRKRAASPRVRQSAKQHFTRITHLLMKTENQKQQHKKTQSDKRQERHVHVCFSTVCRCCLLP